MCAGSVLPLALAAVLTAGAFLGVSPATADASSYDEVIERALRLLPRQPAKISIVERPVAPGQQSGKPRAEAFVVRGDPTVYLVRQSPTLQGALKGTGIFDFALAAIIWHEMAHLDGADEAAAQRAEEHLWQEFILSGRVDRTRGMRYLALLRARG